jgi:hypothetical protein
MTMDDWRPMDEALTKEGAIRLKISTGDEVDALWNENDPVDYNDDLTRPSGRWVIVGTDKDAIPQGERAVGWKPIK